MDSPVSFVLSRLCVRPLSSLNLQVDNIRGVIRSIVEPKTAQEILDNIDKYFTPTANSQYRSYSSNLAQFRYSTAKLGNPSFVLKEAQD